MSEILEICKKVKLLAYFGSYTRQEDFVEGISDINVFLISEDKYLILELASLGYSPIELSEKSFIDLQWCFTNFTQNDTISMEEKNIRAELEKSAYFNTRSKKFSYLLKKLTENEFIYKE